MCKQYCSVRCVRVSPILLQLCLRVSFLASRRFLRWANLLDDVLFVGWKTFLGTFNVFCEKDSDMFGMDFFQTVGLGCGLCW